MEKIASLILPPFVYKLLKIVNVSTGGCFLYIMHVHGEHKNIYRQGGFVKLTCYHLVVESGHGIGCI